VFGFGKDQRLALKLLMVKQIHPYYKKINLTVSSSKQSFELKMSSNVFENKNMK